MHSHQQQPERHTGEDRELLMPRTMTRPAQPRQRQGFHPLMYVGGGMCSMLLAFILILNVSAWWTNTLHDPAYYTQSAHRNSITITTTASQQEQIQAFVDPEGHVDVLVIPTDNVTKARIITGPALANFATPQDAMLSIKVNGSQVIVEATSAMTVNGFTTGRSSMQWSVPSITTSQPKEGK
jgi:hypothetical protein